MKINKVAILGCGVMGSQIAAIFANAKISTILFGFSKNLISCFDQIHDFDPKALTSPDNLERITLASFTTDLELLSDCDLVIEAIAEDITAKQDLYKIIIPHLKKDVILSSNTSGLSINKLSSNLGDFKSRFCGLHFFNPPRYMDLLEIIPSNDFSEGLVLFLETFLTSTLGKNIIFANDTPGFIANRIGVFSMASCMYHAERLSIGFDTVDALTGNKLHRPKSATFRTADLVGLDILSSVLRQFNQELTEDPWHAYFQSPQWLLDLVNCNSLGQKTKSGVYKKINNIINVYNPTTKQYDIANYEIDSEVASILDGDISNQIILLMRCKHPQAQFLYSIIKDTCLYCAHHIYDIAGSCRDIDWALHWGFGWDIGVFELWQLNGVSKTLNLFNLDRDILPPPWIKNDLDFYSNEGSFSPYSSTYIPYSDNPVYNKQVYRPNLLGEPNNAKIDCIIFDNNSAKLFHTGDGVAIFSLKTKFHTLNLEAIQSLKKAINIAEEEFISLVIFQENKPFSAGANLFEIVAAAKLGMIEHQNLFTKLKKSAWHILKPNLPPVDKLIPINEVISLLQDTLMSLRYCNIPTIAVMDGLAIGGGCELLLHCDRRVAHTESYIGLVEMAVGLLPSGGGCKEMARRASRYKNDFTILAKYFEQIGLSKISTSAINAQEMGYLEPEDLIVAQRLELLFIAKKQAYIMHLNNYRPPLRSEMFSVLGSTAKANLLAQLTNMLAGGFISKHDFLIAKKIADIICGGEILPGTKVDSDYLLALEKSHFLELLKTSETQDRIEHMLLNHKPLRN